MFLHTPAAEVVCFFDPQMTNGGVVYPWLCVVVFRVRNLGVDHIFHF